MKHVKTIIMVLACALLVLCGTTLAEEEKKPAGTVDIDEVQVAFLLSGNMGGGKLYFQGKEYPFKIGGLGVGGIGISRLKATGEVYNLEKVEDFPGVYGQARTGLVVTDKSMGHLWLQNTNGVVISLKSDRTGVALTVGADGIVIQMD